MNLKNFQQEISPLILRRGKDYYNEGAVNHLEEEEKGLWNAQVEGTEIYAVEVQLSENGEIDTFCCDCPHDADVCKHIVAVFYELKDQVKTIKLEPEKKKSKALPFNELLKKVSVSELREFVEIFAKNDKNFKEQFELHFAHKDEQVDVEKKYSDLVKKVIRAAMSHGYVDYYSAGDLSAKIDTLLGNAQEAINSGNFKDATAICRVVLKQLIEDVIPSADDSNGDIGDTIFNATSMLHAIAEAELCPREVKEIIHDSLAKELANDNYFDYGYFGDNLFETFRFLSVKLNRAETFLSFSKQLFQRPSDSSSDYRAEYFIKQTILFFQEIGNVPEAEKLIRQNIHIVEVRQSVIAKAIEEKDYLEAKELVYQGIVLAEKKGNPGTVSEWEKVLLNIAVLEGDIDKQRYFNLHFAFDRGFDENYYLQWKNTFENDVWENKFRDLIQKLTNEVELEAEKHLNNHWWSKNNALLNKLAPVYVTEQRWENVFKLVEAYPSLDVLLAYVKYLAKDYQSELTDLFFPALIIAGDRADSRSDYSRVADHMKTVMKLLPNSKSKILEAAQVLRAKYPRRPAMIDELKKVR